MPTVEATATGDWIILSIAIKHLEFCFSVVNVWIVPMPVVVIPT